MNIDIEKIDALWYDGNTPIADLKNGDSIELTNEQAQSILDWCANLASSAEPA